MLVEAAKTHSIVHRERPPAPDIAEYFERRLREALEGSQASARLTSDPLVAEVRFPWEKLKLIKESGQT
jgi:hypothetical protein